MTSPHRTAHTPRMSLVSISVIAAAALSGCSAGADESSGTDGAAASPTPKGVVTADVARATVDTYEKVNNKANKVRDGKLLGTVEGGQVHEQSLADYKQFKTWSKDEQKNYEKPFTYKSREYYIPDADQNWFAVKAKSNGTKSEALMIFDKVDGRFKMVATVWAEDPIPEIAVDRNGLATAVDPAKRVGTIAPNQISAAYEDLYKTGGTKDGAKLASTKTTKEAVKVYQERDNGKEARWSTKKFFTAKPAHPQLYALRLADGGVLTVFPTAHTQERLLKPAYMSSFEINPNEQEAVYNPAGRSLITDEFQGQGLAKLSPKGEYQVIAMEWKMVDSR
ncbi:hypothetical protein FE633_13405 [Streptomyces montanus]|uniref:DUF8094 domain-containing protein n=1 Tax=Streptomyces montanus TaxID=2580423 RepID=A0A5R9FZ11_9ACTN|nr:hypothetical protein [Streptomyces montanus]TLS45754.1 hypothetical protein FE633_13405 [Streptomyces montanus]